MAEISPPAWVESGSNHARAARLLATALVYPGVWATGDLLVTNPSGVNLSVAAGGAYVAATNAANGCFACYNDAIKTGLTVPATPAGTQISKVIARVRAQEFGDGADSFTLEVVSGTAGGGPPTTPNNSLLLATATVSGGASTISILQDNRVLAGRYDGTIPCTSTTRPTGTYLRPGTGIYETDTGKSYLYDGAGWRIALNTTAWTSYTPTFTNCTNPVYTSYYRQLDQHTLYVSFNFMGGTATASAAVTVSLPSGFSGATRIQRWNGTSSTGSFLPWNLPSGSSAMTSSSVTAGAGLITLGGFQAIIEV